MISPMDLPAPIATTLLVALATLGFLCALSETALFSLGRWQIRKLQQLGPAGQRAARLLERPDEVLSALSAGNTLSNGMVVVISLLFAQSRDWNLGLTLLVVFLGVLVLGELLPKTLAVRAPERWAIRVAPAVDLIQWISRPVRRVAQGGVEMVFGWFIPASAKPPPITDEEYRELLEMAFQQGALGRSEKEIIAELITLDRKRARDVMRPRATMAAVADDLSTEEMVSAARRFRHRRLPLYDETPDTIVGVINVQQFLLDPEHRLDEALEFPSFVPETMNLLQVFQALQRQKRSLAIALDEFGAVAGVVRMEDILGEVLGEMAVDGAVRGFVFERVGMGRWRVSGSMRLEDFRREHPALPEVSEIETLGGLLMSHLDIVPAKGESVTLYGLKLTAHEVDERHVHELLVERVGAR